MNRVEPSRGFPNMRIYKAEGFYFVKQMDCDDDGVICRLFYMVRHPQPVA